MPGTRRPRPGHPLRARSPYQTAAATEAYGLVELLAGNPEAAERIIRVGYEQLLRMADTNALPTIAALLGEALVALERYDEALAVTVEAREHADADDLGAQVQWRCAHAKALAWLGRDRTALRSPATPSGSRRAPTSSTCTRMPLSRWRKWAGCRRAAPTSSRRSTLAAKLYAQKGNLVAGARANVALRAARRTRRQNAAANLG